MKILFVCNKYYPTNTASANCVREIIKSITKKGIDCSVLNLTDDLELPRQIQFDNEIIYNYIDISKLKFEQENWRLLSFATKSYMVCDRIIKKVSHFPISKMLCRNIQKLLFRFGSDYDIIVPVVSNVNVGYAVMEYCKKSKKEYVLYQVDPIATNQVLKKYYKRLYDFESKLYQNAKAVITTPILAEEKKDDIRYKDCNIIKAEFPNVRNLMSDNRNEDMSQAICSFCGYIYSGIRDCSYTLKLFDRIKDANIKLQFAGMGQESLIKQYSQGSLEGKLVHMGRLSQQDSVEFMQHSDFLINIGNSMLNQVPSKLFDYISTGLPIINICRNSDCPTIPYMERYGLALNLVETADEEGFESQAMKLREFIFENKGKKHRYATIEELFRENTSGYVGNQFIDIIEKT